ncbi:hypothetical protein CAPTEDRAFT_182542 [Capitella teleta]|uniref:HESR2 n=1 Tax=Capitella teleta TaxID=283909 RepID=R7UZW6_CAPTE|nr:hypothetical protein CAPTEDRAFT_182542 [Capitella teleta]|eukprot:ELU08981.1 hypothetical protein CAPTEDRAFT_182542 [Capitella teleta]
MKRSYSDSEGDDGFAEDDAKICSPSGGGGGSTRKKRRGVIEKRRRDRINQSLGELRRLVPSAFEKQGSAKLEKAEILQMTVDHLKILSSKGLNGYNVDTAALALDYRAIGFRECMSEVSRYLVSMEGLDIQDPLRVRLGSHLQCYSAQRDIATKAAMQSSAPSYPGYSPAAPPSFQSQYSTHPPSATYSTLPPPSQSPPDPLMSSQSARLPAYGDSAGRFSGAAGQMPPLPSSGSTAPASHMLTSSAAQGSLSCLSQMPQFHAASSLSPHHHYPPTSSTSSSFQQSSVRPHRPWGTDLAF